MSISIFAGNNKISEIKSLRFRYTVGNYMYGDVRYELKHEDGEYTALVKRVGEAEEKAYITRVDAQFADSVAALLNKYKVGGWDGFNKSDRRVLDGNSFSLSVRWGGSGSVSASGYMRWPKGYREFREEMNALFMSLRPDTEDADNEA